MQPDLPRLAEAIKARAAYLGWKQRDLLQRTHVSRGTIQTLWKGDATYKPSPATKMAIEDLLGWARDSIDAVLAGGDPTVVREPDDDQPPANSDAPADARASTPLAGISSLPLSVRVGLTDGETLDYERYDWTVEGTSLHLYIIVKAGEITTEDEFIAVRKQMDEWARVKKGIRDVIEGSPDENSDTTSH